jgi:hypothetical protein
MVPDDGAGVTCPADYPDMHIFYDDLKDTRACTECTCAEATPSECSAWVSLFQDDTCTPAQLLSTTLIEPGMPVCNNIQIASPELAGMSAIWAINQPGTCTASGGEPIGEIKPKNPRTFCCQPPRGV